MDDSMLNLYQNLLSTPGQYRFTVIITADGVKEDRLSFTFEWTRQDEFKVNADVEPSTIELNGRDPAVFCKTLNRRHLSKAWPPPVDHVV